MQHNRDVRSDRRRDDLVLPTLWQRIALSRWPLVDMGCRQLFQTTPPMGSGTMKPRRRRALALWAFRALVGLFVGIMFGMIIAICCLVDIAMVGAGWSSWLRVPIVIAAFVAMVAAIYLQMPRPDVDPDTEKQLAIARWEGGKLWRSQK